MKPSVQIVQVLDLPFKVSESIQQHCDFDNQKCNEGKSPMYRSQHVITSVYSAVIYIFTVIVQLDESEHLFF